MHYRLPLATIITAVRCPSVICRGAKDVLEKLTRDVARAERKIVGRVGEYEWGRERGKGGTTAARSARRMNDAVLSFISPNRHEIQHESTAEQRLFAKREKYIHNACIRRGTRHRADTVRILYGVRKTKSLRMGLHQRFHHSPS